VYEAVNKYDDIKSHQWVLFPIGYPVRLRRGRLLWCYSQFFNDRRFQNGARSFYMAEKKFFTLEEANSIIPRLLLEVPKIQGLTSDLRNNFPDVKNAWEKHKYNGGSVQGTQYLGAALKLNRIINDLESKGCIIKGIKEGLVDFLSLRDGREVYLCWRAPEKKIQFWHEIDSGFAGRQPI